MYFGVKLLVELFIYLYYDLANTKLNSYTF